MRPLVCRIADFVVEFINLSLDSQKYFENFLSGDTPEVSFEISEQDIQFEINAVNGKCTRINAELTATLRKFVYWIILIHTYHLTVYIRLKICEFLCYVFY